MPASNSGGKAKPRGRPIQPGQVLNPAGRPKVVEAFRDRCRKAVDEHVIDAWIEEIESRGEYWLKASELVAAYGCGKPPAAQEDREALQARPLVVLSDAEVVQAARALLEDDNG